MTRLALFKMYNQAGLPPSGHHGPPGPLGASLSQASLEMGRAMVEQQARAIQAAQREAEAREKELSSKSPSIESQPSRLNSSAPKDDLNKSSGSHGRSKDSDKSRESRGIEDLDDDLSPPPMKRERQDSFDQRNGSPVGLGAHIRIANRGIYGKIP